MKIPVVPRTPPGKWSLGGLAGFLGFLGLFYAALALGARGGHTFFSAPLLAIPISLAGLSSLTALVVGLFSVVWRRERAALVFLAMLVGAFVAFFIIGEFTTPH